MCEQQLSEYGNTVCQLTSDLYYSTDSQQFNQNIYTPTQSILSSEKYFPSKQSMTSNRSFPVKRLISPNLTLSWHDMTNFEQTLCSPNNKRIRIDSSDSQTIEIESEQLENTPEQEIPNENGNETIQKCNNETLEFILCPKSTDEDRDLNERDRKQRLYNGELIEAFHQRQDIEFELVLEKDPETQNPIIDVSLHLVIDMKPHQIEGVKFLWKQVFQSIENISAGINNRNQEDQGGSGAILAHCMGLGKTFTTIVFLHTLFRHANLTHIKRVLILCPINTTINWKNEFHQWLHDLHPTINIYLFSTDDVRANDREQFLRHWHENGGILLMGYEMYRLLTYTIEDSPYDVRRLFEKKNKKTHTPAELANIQKYRQYLRNPGPDLIVCDEGHMIKNLKSGIACALNQIRTRRRIILTGTPMQNNLKEYYAMVHFCKPNFLGTESLFSDRFRKPIEAGQHRDSSKEDVDYMRRRIYALRRRLEPLIDRQGFEVLRSFLPQKFEYAIKIKCRPLQRKLYETYIQYQNLTAKLNVAKLFADYQYLMKIWTHPWLLQPYFIDYYNKKLKDDDQTVIDAMIKDEFDNDTERIRDVLPTPNMSIASPEEKILKAMKEQWWFNIFDPHGSQFDFELSGKFDIFKAILDECESIGDKLLVFTRHLMTLDYFEQCLAYWSAQHPESQWKKGVDYFRMDGSVSIKKRAADMKLFNDTNNSRSRLYLISTLAGGLGVNLFSANRVIILDTSWNPAHDLQAMFRSYRLGQTKPVYIYRLMVKGTMEEKIYKRQITKQAMFHRVVDAKQLARHFTYDELAQLYQFDFDVEDDPMDRANTNGIQDKMLRHLLQNHSDTIVSYREHDSFLIHNDQDNLTIEEENQAKDEDENPSARFSRKRQYASELFTNAISTNSELSYVEDNDELFRFLMDPGL